VEAARNIEKTETRIKTRQKEYTIEEVATVNNGLVHYANNACRLVAVVYLANQNSYFILTFVLAIVIAVIVVAFATFFALAALAAAAFLALLFSAALFLFLAATTALAAAAALFASARAIALILGASFHLLAVFDDEDALAFDGGFGDLQGGLLGAAAAAFGRFGLFRFAAFGRLGSGRRRR